MPDKAIDVLDEAGSRVHMGKFEVPEEILELEEEIEQVRREKAAVVKRQDYEEAARLRDKERNLQADVESEKREWDAKTRDIVHDVTEEDIATVVAMMTGKLPAMQAYTSGRLKIEGDLMKSQLIEKLFKF